MTVKLALLAQHFKNYCNKIFFNATAIFLALSTIPNIEKTFSNSSYLIN